MHSEASVCTSNPVNENHLLQNLVPEDVCLPPQSPPSTETLPELLSQFKSQTATVFSMSSKVTCAAGSRGGAILGLESGEVVHVGNTLTVLGKHNGSVTCVAAVDMLAASGSEDCTLSLWSDNKLVKVLKGHQKTVSCTAFTNDASKVVSGSFDHSIRVWSLSDLKEIACLLGHSSYIKCVTTTTDGHRAISGALDGSIIVWNIDSLTEEKRLQGHQRMIWCLTAWENYLVSGSWDNTLKLWDTEEWEELATLPGLTHDGSKVPFTRDGRYLVCGADNNELKAWQVADPTIVESLQGHEGPITCVAVTPKYIISGSEDCTLRVWSSDDMQVIATLQGHADKVAMVVVTPDYKRVVSVDMDNGVRVWSVDDMKEVATLLGHAEQVTSLAVEGWRAVTGSVDKTVRVWDTQTMTTLAVLTGHADRVNTVAISSDAFTAVSGSKDATLRTWDLTTFEEKLSFEEHTGPVYCCLLIPNKTTVVSGSVDKTIRLWELNTGAELTILRGHREGVWSLALASENTVLISGSADQEIRLWRLATYEEIGVLIAHSGCVRCLAVTRDWLVSGSSDKTIKVWTLSSQTVLFTLKGHTSDICSLAITPDSEFLLSGSEDSTARIWSLRDMKELLSLPCPSACTALAVSSRHALLASARLVSIINLNFELQPYRLSLFSSVLTYSEAEYQDSYSLLCANAECLRTGQLVHLQVAAHIVYPHFFNSLHICAYYNHFERLAQYLAVGVPLLRGRFGSPLTVALERSTHKCIEVLLQHLLTCKSSVLSEVTDDLPMLLRAKSPFIAPFFDTLLRSTEQDELPQFISPVSPLPIIRFSPGTFIRAEDFGLPHELTNTEVVEFQASVFRWNFTIGSSDSVRLLRALEHCTDARVLTTDLVATLIEQKWEALWLLTLAMTALYVGLLLTLVCMQFSELSPVFLKIIFLGLNVFFLIYEGVQAAVSGREYLLDTWNSLDLVRGLIAIAWVIQTLLENQRRELLQFLVVALCFTRGFTYFRTFKMTRLFVRMTLEVIKEMYSFLAILLYSTFAFGLMYSALDPDELHSLGQAWAVAYELIMGQFNNKDYGFTQWLCFTSASLLNVIIMLNLLISILGDAYERAQMSAKENDLCEMLRLVIEYESMLFWRRAYGQPCVVIKCCSNSGAAVSDEWEGRVARMIKGVNEEITALESRLTSRMDAVETRLQGHLSKVDGKLDMLIKALTSA